MISSHSYCSPMLCFESCLWSLVTDLDTHCARVCVLLRVWPGTDWLHSARPRGPGPRPRPPHSARPLGAVEARALSAHARYILLALRGRGQADQEQSLAWSPYWGQGAAHPRLIVHTDYPSRYPHYPHPDTPKCPPSSSRDIKSLIMFPLLFTFLPVCVSLLTMPPQSPHTEHTLTYEGCLSLCPSPAPVTL